jgi:hypothetical protein
MDATAITTLRQLPRKTRIISDTGDDGLTENARDRGAHENRLVEVEADVEALGGDRADGRQELLRRLDNRQC